MLVKYVRNKKGVPVGCVLTYWSDGDVKIGWSLCHKDDKFDKRIAKWEAINRAVFVWEKDKIFVTCPISLHKEMKKMLNRADRYYKERYREKIENDAPKYVIEGGGTICEPEPVGCVFVPELNQFCNYCHEVAKSKGWWDEPRSDLECMALVASEVGEVIEELRKGDEIYNDVSVMDNGKPEGAAVEIADIFIRLADLLGKHGVDFESVMLQKLQFNLTRPYRHGNKKY